MQEILHQLRVNRQPATVTTLLTHNNNPIQPANNIKTSENDTLLHDLMERISLLERENSSTISVQSMAITSLPPSPSHYTANNVHHTQHNPRQQQEGQVESKEKDYKRQESFRFFEAQLEQRLSSSDDDQEDLEADHIDDDEDEPVEITDLDSLNGDRDGEGNKPDIYFVSGNSDSHYESQDQDDENHSRSHLHHQQIQQQQQEELRQFLSPPVDSDDDGDASNNNSSSHQQSYSSSQQQQQQYLRIESQAEEEDDLDSVLLSDLLQFKV